MAAQVTAVGGVVAVGLDHHGHGVPAHVGAQATFQFQVARAVGLFLRGDGVDVAGVGRERHVDAVLARMLQQLLQQEVGALGALLRNHGLQGVFPFKCFLAVEIFDIESGKVLGHGGHAWLLSVSGLWPM